MKVIEKISERLNRIMIVIAGVFLTAMVVLTCGNIISRLVWVPIRGTFELMGFFGAITTSFALGYTQIKKGHIAVDVLITKFSTRTLRVLSVINASGCMIFFIIVGWQISEKAGVLKQSGEITETLGIIYYPFTYGVAVGCMVLALVFFVDLLNCLFPKAEE